MNCYKLEKVNLTCAVCGKKSEYDNFSYDEKNLVYPAPELDTRIKGSE